MSIGLGEIIVIFIVAFLVVGPEDMPKVARTIAQWVRKIRSMTKELTKTMEKEMDVAEVKAAQENIHKVSSEFERIQQEVLLNAQKESEASAGDIEKTSTPPQQVGDSQGRIQK